MTSNKMKTINTMSDEEYKAHIRIIKNIVECYRAVRREKGIGYGKAASLQFDLCNMAVKYSIEIFGSESVAYEVFLELSE